MSTTSLAEHAHNEPVSMERGCPFNPANSLTELRDTQPITRTRFPNGEAGWLVTNYELARTVLSNSSMSSYFGGSPSGNPLRLATKLLDAMRQDPDFPEKARALVERYDEEGRLLEAFRQREVVQALIEHSLPNFSLTMKDRPEHTRLRRIVAPYFTVNRVEDYRTVVERIVADRLDFMEQTGSPIDLVQAFALTIPSLVTCALYGVPEEDRGAFLRFSEVGQNPRSTLDEILAADAEFRTFIRELIARKRRAPGDDVISSMILQDELSEEELVTMATTLVLASHAAVGYSLTFAVATLLDDRDRWNELVNETAAIEQIVEELLRYTTPGQLSDVRTAMEDLEIGGVSIKAFERIAVSLVTANRDPEAFSEPDEVDFTRQAAKHLSFGYGIHQCAGQHLARLVLQVALTALARRFPSLDLAVPVRDVPWHHPTHQVYAPLELHVTW